MSWLSFKILSLIGWQLVGQLPNDKKIVIIIAPHTSNWDFFMFVLVKFALRLKVSFFGKHSIFIGPVGWLLKKMGGIPVERTSRQNIVDSIVDEINSNKEFIFGLSPEGTRTALDHWKSGFYYIARKADIPLVLAYLDTTSKTIGFGPSFKLTADKDEDLKKIANFYSNKKGFKPEKYSRPIFK